MLTACKGVDKTIQLSDISVKIDWVIYLSFQKPSTSQTLGRWLAVFHSVNSYTIATLLQSRTNSFTIRRFSKIRYTFIKIAFFSIVMILLFWFIVFFCLQNILWGNRKNYGSYREERFMIHSVQRGLTYGAIIRILIHLKLSYSPPPPRQNYCAINPSVGYSKVSLVFRRVKKWLENHMKARTERRWGGFVPHFSTPHDSQCRLHYTIYAYVRSLTFNISFRLK